MSKKNPFYNDTYLQELLQEGGGSGGDVTKEYVDQQDQALSQRIAQNTTNITNLSNSKADRAELANKLDKLTDEGVGVYSHSGETQGEFSVKTTMPDTPTDTELVTAKGVKTYVDNKNPLAWKYVGILSASHGSTLTVEDDWTELLITMRISEGSSTYNLTSVLPKEGFTRGNPTGNQTFAGFYWNDSYKATVRLGLEETGSNRKIKLNYSDATGWVINGLYILKR